MSIDLKFLLHKNKITIAQFLIVNKIKSYAGLKEYCSERSILPIDEKEYEAIVKKENVKKEADVSQKKPPQKDTKRKTTKRTRATRKSSKS